MRHCPYCSGVIGVDCFNVEECGDISRQMQQSAEYDVQAELATLRTKLESAEKDNPDISILLAEVERKWPGSFWHLAKGRVRSSEPLFGFQVLFGTEEVLAEGEGDSATSAIRAALSSIRGEQP